MTNQTASQECCPQFNPAKWDKKSVVWDSKKFVKDSLPTLFHIPFPPMIGSKITRMWNAVEKSGAKEEKSDETLILFRDPSAFRSEIYISVAKDVPAENNVTVSGNFVARVFDGEYNAIPRFIKEMDGFLAASGNKAKDYYVHYAYCPKCAKKYGHNYMILFAKV